MADQVEPSDLDATCPNCGTELWAMRKGQWSMKSAILKLAGSRFIARCPRPKCRGELIVPWLQIESLAPRRARRAVIAKRLDRSTPDG